MDTLGDFHARLRNPDGLLIKVCMDAYPALWAARPESVATARALCWWTGWIETAGGSRYSSDRRHRFLRISRSALPQSACH